MRESLVALTLTFALALLIPGALAAEPAPPVTSTSESLADQPQQPAPPTEAELESWLAGLDANKYAQREAATDALGEAGAVAVPYLRRAALGDSLEAADRAVWILKKFAESTDEQLKLDALTVLADTERFPGIVREAELALAEIYEQLCQTHLEELGAEFTIEQGGVNLVNLDAEVIKVNTNREQWKGTVDDVMMLAKLRQVAMLRVACSELKDEHVRQLAGIEGLEIIELVETKTSIACVDELKQTHPQLRVRLKNRTMLGVKLSDLGAPTVRTIYPDKPAAKAGMRTGDVILKFDGHDILTFDELTTRISQHQPGDKVEIVVDREGSEETLIAELEQVDWSKDDPLSEEDE
ncbi:serine endoprotease [Aeoliella mucimassa]|uniref:Serine endoprotease n=2 Tax=Aeoliella mucimassa TaxID=2527972 RepID=A0A518AK91_9BACT|nr:serine endoprotease [Aeoliella mucimassa]